MGLFWSCCQLEVYLHKTSAGIAATPKHTQQILTEIPRPTSSLVGTASKGYQFLFLTCHEYPIDRESIIGSEREDPRRSCAHVNGLFTHKVIFLVGRGWKN
jgi:hypothetical protein